MNPNQSRLQWLRKPAGFFEGELGLPLTGIVFTLLALFACNYLLLLLPEYKTGVIAADILLLTLGVYLVIISYRRIRQNLLQPLVQMRNWAYAMQDGDLTARIPLPDHGEFLKLAIVINDLGDSMYSLSLEMDEKVREQTQRLEQKSKMLEILYEVAATSNAAHDIEELLQNYLFTLFNLVKASAATVRVITDDNKLRVIGNIGIDEIAEEERSTPIERCLCAQDFSNHVISCEVNRGLCGNLLNKSLPLPHGAKTIALPLQYQNRALGIYHLYVPEIDIGKEPELNNILTNIGQHLSLAMETARLDNESKRLHIMQERTMLAHELHDSLAQTLASLRFQVNLLEKTLKTTGNATARHEVEQLKNGLDEANNELRELLAHFRVHMDERGLIPATEALIERFQNESGIAVFFQNQCPDLKLPPIQEVQVLHIIQESLTNARKHSQAKNVRILIRQTTDERYHVLIEDDGVGIDDQTIMGHPGEHVGLSIMKERARRINGEVTIESEPGEGTRIELDFPVSSGLTQNTSGTAGVKHA
jgi:two-component system nitrate/nitrite sensor histidine kinase NarX